MLYRLLKKYLFLFLLCGLLPAGCENGFNGDSSEEIPGELPEGAILFGMDGSVQTKSLPGGNLTADGWETVTVSLDDSLLASGVPHSPASQGAGTSGGNAAALSAGAVSGISTKGTPVTGTSAPAGSLGVLGYLLTGGVWNTATATPNFMYNTQLIRTGSSGSYSYTYSPARYWPNDTNDKVRFFAYYPYKGNGISLSSASATGYPAITYTPSANVTDQVDLLYAASTEAVNNKTTGTAVNFALTHALTRISFSVMLDSDLVDKTVLIQSIQMTGLKSSGTLSLDPAATNPWTPGMGTASYTASVSNGALIPAANQAFSIGDYLPVTTPSGYFLLLPQTVTTANTVVVAYTVDGKARTMTYLISDDTWSMGQSLNYQLTIPPVTANCYIIVPGSSLAIPVSIKGNGISDGGIGIPMTHRASSVAVLWQTTAGLITVNNFNAARQRVTLTASGSTGNAVVAAYAADGTTILWSWHIWVTNYDPDTPSNGTVYTLANSVTSNVFMDRNLGALTNSYSSSSVDKFYYQWGRKDPFPKGNVVDASGATVSRDVTSATSVQSVEYTVLHPFVYIASGVNSWCSSWNVNLWGGNADSPKTIFDPCPIGWRMPSYYKTSEAVSPWQKLARASSVFTYAAEGYGGSFSNGWTYTKDGNVIGFYTKTGYLNNDGIFVVDINGFYWSANPYSYSGYSGSAIGLSFGSTTSTVGEAANSCWGRAVRCVKEW